MFCKRLKATMKISTCLKRQEKAHYYLNYEACRECPQLARVQAGKESDRDVERIIRELSQTPVLPGFFPWAAQKAGRAEARGNGKRPKLKRVRPKGNTESIW
jgi:hypothetical protein